MHLYWELILLSIQRHFTYRASAMAGLATNLFFGLLRASVMIALFQARPTMEGMTVNDAVTYTGLSQATIAFLALFSWFEIMNSVYSGQISSDLLKPMHYFTFWLAQDFGRALVNLLLRGATIMLFYALVFGITTPRGLPQWLAFIVALFFAWLLSFSWRFLVNLAAFWTPNAIGVARLLFGLSWILSGFLMPLRFFPEWFNRLCYLTPFPHTVNTIVEVYLGLLSRTEIIHALLLQLAWIVALVLLGHLVMRAGVHRLVIQGG